MIRALRQAKQIYVVYIDPLFEPLVWDILSHFPNHATDLLMSGRPLTKCPSEGWLTLHAKVSKPMNQCMHAASTTPATCLRRESALTSSPSRHWRAHLSTLSILGQCCSCRPPDTQRRTAEMAAVWRGGGMVWNGKRKATWRMTWAWGTFIAPSAYHLATAYVYWNIYNSH